MNIQQLLNWGAIQKRKDTIEYLEIATKPKEGRHHLTWKKSEEKKP